MKTIEEIISIYTTRSRTNAAAKARARLGVLSFRPSEKAGRGCRTDPVGHREHPDFKPDYAWTPRSRRGPGNVLPILEKYGQGGHSNPLL